MYCEGRREISSYSISLITVNINRSISIDNINKVSGLEIPRFNHYTKIYRNHLHHLSYGNSLGSHHFTLLFKVTSWRKRLVARIPPLGSRVLSVTPCGFCGGRNGVWVGFSRGFSRFPLPHFISSFLHIHLIHFVSFHQSP